jgi:16S rRNA (guanine527-N7)-methyltransferase
MFHVKHSDSPQQISQFKKICSSFGMNLTDEMIKKFQDYVILLLDWNKRIHLVSNKDAKADRIIRHFVDSLCMFKVVDIPKDAHLLDVGSGAGFPSIPIKIVREDVNLTLVESIHKKALFSEKLCEVVGLEKVSILNKRAEKLLEEGNFKNNFDLVTAKALGNFEDTAHLSTSFLKAEGLLVAYKGKGAKKEVDEAKIPKQCQIKDVVKIEIPEMDLLRWLIVVERLV